MIKFVAGIHGVGKGTYIQNEYVDTPAFACSNLIKRIKKENVNTDKRVISVINNQEILKEAVKRYIDVDSYILDGHFTLINSKNEVEDIPIETYESLQIDEIEVLIANASIVSDRINKRDGKVTLTIEQLNLMQARELYLASEYSQKLRIPLKGLLWSRDLWVKVNIHSLKVDQEYYELTESNLKNYEIRNNERDFAKDDIVVLNEVDKNKEYTGRYLVRKIGTLTNNFKPLVDIGYVVFSLELI